MILRAMIGMGLVLLLASHETGLALPGLGTACTGACAGGLSQENGQRTSQHSLGQRTGQRTLADVKAEIDASLKARGRPFYDL
jgi:hypothetical protein